MSECDAVNHAGPRFDSGDTSWPFASCFSALLRLQELPVEPLNSHSFSSSPARERVVHGTKVIGSDVTDRAVFLEVLAVDQQKKSLLLRVLW